jgi:hypothetical protein
MTATGMLGLNSIYQRRDLHALHITHTAHSAHRRRRLLYAIIIADTLHFLLDPSYSPFNMHGQFTPALFLRQYG